MRGLVTVFGGSGFVGRAVVRALAKDGWRVRVAVRRPHLAGAIKLAGHSGQVHLVGGDVKSDRSVQAAVAGAEAVVNLVGILQEVGGQKFSAVQGEGARRVAEAARAAGVGRFVQMSAIGAGEESRSMYGRSKAEGETAARDSFPHAVVLRPSIIFGPEDSFFNRFAAMAQLSPALPLIGSGRTRFQPVFVGDVAEAVARALASPSHAGRTFELGGPSVYSFRELLERVLAETRLKRALVPLPFPVARLMGQGFDLAGKVVPFLPRPLTADQVRLLETDNVVSDGAAGLAELGITPTGIDAVVPTYLWRYRKGGQFAEVSGAGLSGPVSVG